MLEENRGLVLRLGDALGFALFRGQARADGRAGAFVAAIRPADRLRPDGGPRRGTRPPAQGERTPGARLWIRSRAGWPTRLFAAGRRRRSFGSWKPHSRSARPEFAKLTERLAQLEKRADSFGRQLVFFRSHASAEKFCDNRQAREHRPAHRRAADAAFGKSHDRHQRRKDRAANRREPLGGVAMDAAAARRWACA